MNLNIDSAKETRLREEIVQVGKLLYDRGYIVAADGNISARLNDDLILATPSGLCKGMMRPEQLIITSMQGERVGLESSESRNLKPTSETFMHLEAYKLRPDVEAVVHAHPYITVALSIAGVSLAECMVPEVIVGLGLIQTTRYATPASRENVTAIHDLIGNHDALVLQRHGALTVGKSPMDAYFKMETVEQISKIKQVLLQVGAGDPLEGEQVEKLLAQRRKLGLSRPGEDKEFCELCSACHLDGHPASAPKAAAGSNGHQNNDEDLVRLITNQVMAELKRG